MGTSLDSVLQMQQLWVWPLVQEGPTGHEAARPMSHKRWPSALEPGSHPAEAHGPWSPCCTGQEPPRREAWAQSVAAAQHDQRKAHAAARTRPSHEEVNKTRFQFTFSPYFTSEVATLHSPDGIACRKWAETSGFICAGFAHMRHPVAVSQFVFS